MLRTQLYRVITSPLLYIGAVIYAAAIVITGIYCCDTFHPGTPAGIDIFIGGTNYSGYTITLYLPAILCVLPCAGLLCEDISGGGYKYTVMRGGITRYHLSKLAAAAVSAVIFCAASFVLAFAAAYILYPGLTACPRLMLRYPPFDTAAAYLSAHCYTLLPVWTCCFTTLHCITFSLLSLAVSSLLKNRYLIYASGLICFVLWCLISGVTGCISCTASVYANFALLEYSPLRLIISNITVIAASCALFLILNTARREQYV